MALTEKQRVFVAEYLVDLNATQAAIRAGYSERTAKSQGQRLLTKADVQAEVQALRAGMQSDAIARAQEVLEMLTRAMRREEVENIVIKTKTRRSYHDEAGKKVTEETETPEVVEVPSKLADAIRAAESLGRYHTLFVDKTEISGGTDSTVTLRFEDMPDGGDLMG